MSGFSKEPVTLTGLDWMFRNIHGLRDRWIGLISDARELFNDPSQYSSGRPSDRLRRISDAFDKVSAAMSGLQDAIHPPVVEEVIEEEVVGDSDDEAFGDV